MTPPASSDPSRCPRDGRATFPSEDGEESSEAEGYGRYLVRRFLLMVLTLFGMSVLIFVMLRLVPGNIADILVDASGCRSGGEGQDRARARHRPSDRRAVRDLDQRPGARRPRLRLCLGAPGDRGDRPAHPDQRQAGRHGDLLRHPVRRAVRRDQRGAAEHAARLFPAGAQSQRPVVTELLARPAGADGVGALVRHDPDLRQQSARLPAGRGHARPAGDRRWASEVRR